jgi:hypothetical protein
MDLDTSPSKRGSAELEFLGALSPSLVKMQFHAKSRMLAEVASTAATSTYNLETSVVFRIIRAGGLLAALQCNTVANY